MFRKLLPVIALAFLTACVAPEAPSASSCACCKEMKECCCKDKKCDMCKDKKGKKGKQCPPKDVM